MSLKKIISINGKPGLYKIIAQSKGGIIVESLMDKKRFPVTSVHHVSTLNDIAIYTYEEEVPLKDVFVSMYTKEEGKTAINHKESSKVLNKYFLEVLPDYDEERVYASNIKKVIQWYNLLIDSGFDFSSIKEDTLEEEVQEENKEA